MLRIRFRFTVYFLILTTFSPRLLQAAPTEFTAQVYLKKNGELVGNLVKEDFRLFENLREQTILDVKRETLPLSIVLIPMIGRGQYCDTMFLIIPKEGPSNNMSLVADSFQKYLEDEDEFAIILPDQNRNILRDFTAPKNRIAQDFATLRFISDTSQRLIDDNVTTPGEILNTKSESEKIYEGVDTIYLEPALDVSLEYLQQNSKPGSRQVIFFLRPFYNLQDLTDYKEGVFRQNILKQGTIFNWIGDDGAIFPRGFSQFYRNLPDLTGSEKEPCRLLKSKDPEKIQSVVSRMLIRLRTRYKITYTSNNSSTLGNLRKIKLQLSKAGKRKTKGQFVMAAPQMVYVQ